MDVPCQSAKTISVVPGGVVDEPEHGEGHGDEADGQIGDGQVDDEQVASGASLGMPDSHPAHAQVGDHAGYDEHAKMKEEHKNEIVQTFQTGLFFSSLNELFHVL